MECEIKRHIFEKVNSVNSVNFDIFPLHLVRAVISTIPISDSRKNISLFLKNIICLNQKVFKKWLYVSNVSERRALLGRKATVIVLTIVLLITLKVEHAISDPMEPSYEQPPIVVEYSCTRETDWFAVGVCMVQNGIDWMPDCAGCFFEILVGAGIVSPGDIVKVIERGTELMQGVVQITEPLEAALDLALCLIPVSDCVWCAIFAGETLLWCIHENSIYGEYTCEIINISG